MKTYYDFNSYIILNHASIPKDINNADYAWALKEIEAGNAVLVPYTSPVPTWAEIRSKRDRLLTESDWISLPDATPKPSKETWLNYRQALRDITKTFSSPEAVIWPTMPS